MGNSNTKDPLPQKGAITIMMDPPQLQMEDFHQLLRISMPQSNNLRRVRLCLSRPKTTVTACSLQKMPKQRRTVILRRKEEERRKILTLTKENSLKKLKNLKKAKAPTSKKKESKRSMRNPRKRTLRNPRKRDHPRKRKKLETTDKVKVSSIFEENRLRKRIS